jgi:hypothetical protein
MTADLREYDDFTKNFVADRPIIEVLDFTKNNNLRAVGPLAIESLGNGNPQLLDINTSDIAGMTFNANGEIYGFEVELPYDMDPNQDVDFRLKWSNSAAAATGSALWILLYNAVITANAGTAIAIGATALDTPYGVDVDAGADIQKWTPWGTIAAGGLSALTPGDDCLDMSLEMDTFDTIVDATLYKVQMRYYKRMV